MKTVRAFTLIELLVVISIIGLLVAILLPALAAARASGRNVQCLSNSRQIGMAYYAFSADYKGAHLLYKNGGPAPLWFAELVDYGMSPASKACPEANALDPATEFGGQQQHYGTATSQWKESTNWLTASQQGKSEFEPIGSYGMNGWVYDLSDPNVSSDAPGLSIEQVRELNFNSQTDLTRTTEIPFFGDAAWRDGFNQETDAVATDPYNPWALSPSTGISQWQMRRHPNDVNNIAFADGHAASINVNDLDTLLWHKEWDTENTDLDVAW